MNTIFKKIFVTIFSLAAFFMIASPSFAFTYFNQNFNHMFYQLKQKMNCCRLDCAHWYVSGNIGVSHLFDKRTPGTTNSVDQNGPGWNANLGYQWNSLFGAELGYTQYHDSRETSGPLNIAKTEHYAVSLAATGHLPIICRLSVLGKLGLAYSYANKIFNAGAAASSGAVSAYYGLGLEYALNNRTGLQLQWARARGNDYTGSSDLYSLGVTFAIV